MNYTIFFFLFINDIYLFYKCIKFYFYFYFYLLFYELYYFFLLINDIYLFYKCIKFHFYFYFYLLFYYYKLFITNFTYLLLSCKRRNSLMFCLFVYY